MTAIYEIRAPIRDIRRYCPDRPFPAYRFVPGQGPHPRLDPAGHSYGSVTENPAAEWDPTHWQHLGAWRWGIDLFNHFYFWEAHEAWEELWRTTGRSTPPGLLLQGLIQIAAALLKVHTRATRSARRLSEHGVEKLKRAAAVSPQMMGLELTATITEMETYFRPLADDAQLRLDASVPILWLTEAGRTPGDVQR